MVKEIVGDVVSPIISAIPKDSGEEPPIPANALTHEGEVLTHEGEILTHG